MRAPFPSVAVALLGSALAFPGMKHARRATYPYLGASNGVPGNGQGGVQVPAPGDTAHVYVPPGPNDVRGACTGLNLLANHNFISHDGIATYTSVLDAAQNVYNFGYDLAQVLSVAAIAGAGDTTTQKFSIGRDQTAKTAPPGSAGIVGPEGGINWHDHVEFDASLFRNDYYLANGDNYKFNTTLWAQLDQTCNSVYDKDCVADFHYARYEDSLQRNPNFMYGVGALAFSGVGSFLYALFPSYGDQGPANFGTVSSIFGVTKSGNSYSYVPERLPDNWHNRPTPYTLVDLAENILYGYNKHPVLIGGKTSDGSFNGLPIAGIKDGKLESPNVQTVLCLLYQLFISGLRPAGIGNIVGLAPDRLIWAASKLNPIFANYGCPLYTP